MPKKTIVPCIWLDDQAQELAERYCSLFPGSRITATSHYPESRDNPSGKPRGSVLTVEFEVAGQPFTALNGGPMFKPNPTLSFMIQVQAVEEAERVFELLAKGGKVLMPIQEYPWSKRYGWVQDRFGVSFQVNTGEPSRNGSRIAPCLMFTGAQHGRAEDAMKLYTRIFPGGSIDFVARYEANEKYPGKIKHARFSLAGQDMVAMDSHVDNRFTFDEGMSLQVMCDTQAEVDRHWDALSREGSPGPCGWLKDPFGVSWQIVPSAISRWLTSDDRAARDRAFDAVMQMKKLDIATIEAAFAGR